MSFILTVIGIIAIFLLLENWVMGPEGRKEKKVAIEAQWLADRLKDDYPGFYYQDPHYPTNPKARPVVIPEEELEMYKLKLYGQSEIRLVPATAHLSSMGYKYMLKGTTVDLPVTLA